MIVLGIESSCDETGVAIYDSEQGIIAEQLHSQIALHRQYGGVVPELASRDHIKRIVPLIKATLAEASLDYTNLDAIAYTAGPGLLGALLSGASVAQGLAFSLAIPSIGIHHMEGHLLSPLLACENAPSFPFLALLVSGGHTLLIAVKQVGDYQILGSTIDDAVGEAFDKTGKLLGLPYPGGPEVAKLADGGDPQAFDLPRPMLGRPGLDFSFSGLKTQTRLLIEQYPDRGADIAASFQQALIDTLLKKCQRALKQAPSQIPYQTLMMAGGVSANQSLRQQMQAMCDRLNIRLVIPPPALCTDNGAMIAYAGALRLQHENLARYPRDYAIVCQARWSLDELSVPTS